MPLPSPHPATLKKKLLLSLLILLAVAIGIIVYRLGNRSLTILRNDIPAAGETIQWLGPKGSQTLTLDANGRLELPWGLSEDYPQFFFRAGKDRNYQMKLPTMGQRTYNVWDRGLTRFDVVLEFGPFAWTERVGQE